MKILLLVYGGLGDAVIMLHLIKYLSLKKDMRIDVFTDPRFADLFKNNTHVTNVLLQYDLDMMSKYKIMRYVRTFVKAIFYRKNRYDIVLNIAGDFKHNTLGWLFGGKQNISIRTGKNHPYINLITPGCDCLVDKYIDIPDSMISAYDMHKYAAEVILGRSLSWRAKQNKPTAATIAIHPKTSAKNKTWEYGNWVELIKKIYKNDKIIVFCAPHEKEAIKNAFLEVHDKIKIAAEKIEIFLKELKDVKIFIGLDSFSVHAAYYVGVANIIMLNGVNDARLYAPPGANVVQGGECDFCPCYNHVKCTGKPFEYACMKSIRVENVLDVFSKIENNISI
jgi:heptosyltransferase-3